MKKKKLLIMVIIPTLIFAQDKKFASFELLFDTPQSFSKHDDWPEFGLETIDLYNDTIYTLLIKKNNLACFPLSNKGNKVEYKKLNLPDKCFPFSFVRNNGKWYFSTFNNGVGYLTENGFYKKIIAEKTAENLFCLQNNLLLFSEKGISGQGIFDLYNIEGKLLNSLKCKNIILMYPIINDNKILDGYCEITINNNIIKVTESYSPQKYGNESIFIGGWQNLGYFVNWEERNLLSIKDLNDKSTKERFIIPVKFKDTDLGIPEEDSINLRVFSEDNNTFYFVTLKHGHLLIYKAVR